VLYWGRGRGYTAYTDLPFLKLAYTHLQKMFPYILAPPTIQIICKIENFCFVTQIPRIVSQNTTL